MNVIAGILIGLLVCIPEIRKERQQLTALKKEREAKSAELSSLRRTAKRLEDS